MEVVFDISSLSRLVPMETSILTVIVPPELKISFWTFIKMHVLQFALRWGGLEFTSLPWRLLFTLRHPDHFVSIPCAPWSHRVCICVLCFAAGETQIQRWSWWWKSKLEVKHWSWMKLKSNRRIHKERYIFIYSPQPNIIFPSVLPGSSRHSKATHYTKLAMHTSMPMLLFVPGLMFSLKRLGLNSDWVHWQNKFPWIQLAAK